MSKPGVDLRIMPSHLCVPCPTCYMAAGVECRSKQGGYVDARIILKTPHTTRINLGLAQRGKESE